MGVARENFGVRVARILWKLVIHFPRIAPVHNNTIDRMCLTRRIHNFCWACLIWAGFPSYMLNSRMEATAQHYVLQIWILIIIIENLCSTWTQKLRIIYWSASSLMPFHFHHTLMSHWVLYRVVPINPSFIIALLDYIATQKSCFKNNSAAIPGYALYKTRLSLQNQPYI